MQEHFLCPGSSTHPLKHPPELLIAAGGITMSQAPLVAAPTSQFELCACAHDSVSLPGTNHIMCPGGPELPLNTMCNVGSRLRGLLQEKPLAGENLAFRSQGSQNRNLQIPFGSLVHVMKSFVHFKSTWALLCLRGCTGWMLLTQGAHFQYSFSSSSPSSRLSVLY